ncbi:hypothetical protein COCMIDRAFT_100313, partial [Bipolaris oryzae ATCC 44560]
IHDSYKSPWTLSSFVYYFIFWSPRSIAPSFSFPTGLEGYRYYFGVLHFPSDERGYETTVKTISCSWEDFGDGQSMRHAGDATVACKGDMLRPKTGCVCVDRCTAVVHSFLHILSCRRTMTRQQGIG